MSIKILGLDLGTNSVGWALVEIDHEKGIVKVIGLGARILPMDAGEIGDFESSGKIKSPAAARTEKRGPRRVNERYLLRRDRLHLVLNLFEALPKHYKLEIDFERNGKKCGQFKPNKEPKLAYIPSNGNPKKKVFIFEEAYKEMLQDIGIENKKGCRIPKDWTLYYLRYKALLKEITLEELAWVLLSYNQKRGYEKIEIEDKSTKEDKIIEELDLQVKNVLPKFDEESKKYFEIHLNDVDGFMYKEYSDIQMTEVGDLKEVVKVSKVDEQGNIDPQKTEYIIIDIYTLKISDVAYLNENGKHQYTLDYDNGWQEIWSSKKYTFRYKSAIGKHFDYIVETTYSAEGDIKTVQGKERKLREPDFGDNSNDWTLLKKRTEKEALKFNAQSGFTDESNNPKNYLSPQIYHILKKDAKTQSRTKIIGGMFQTVDRRFYREELKQIVQTQKEFHNNLKDRKIFEKCVETLYPKNENYRKLLLDNKDVIEHLLVEDILLYQRPLKRRKSQISNCKYEIGYWKEVIDKRTGKPIELIDTVTGEITIKKEPVYLKAVSASHPYFQEFRIWDKLHNLKIIQLEKEEDGKLQTNVDVTKDYFKTEKEYQELFNELNNRKSLDQNQFLKYCKEKFRIPYQKKDSNYVWNFPEDDEIKGDETRVSFATRFKRCGFTDYANFLTQEKEKKLWHYLYSVNYKERTERDNKSVRTFFNRFLEGSGVCDEVKEKIIRDFANYPKFASKYCAYSEKALKKLLPFIRLGESRFKGKFNLSENENGLGRTDLWKHSINDRVDEILKRLKSIDFTTGKIDYSEVVSNNKNLGKGELPFPQGLFNAFKNFKKSDDFTNLNLTQASYLVYGRHSELAQVKYWTSPDQIRKELHQELKQHSLNNPVAEKVILEMMQVVADIWEYYGNSGEKFFNKIHLEVGRELKKSAKEKNAETDRQKSNRVQNKRIRQVLEEFLTNSSFNANHRNMDHFERLKIVEESAEHTKNINKNFFEGKPYTKKEIDEILKKPAISRTDFEKYKLWIEQGYKSPYTNKMIKLTDLFDGNKYNIDHILPQASVTNDSLNNKVVCEREVNKLKADKTGREFVSNPGQREVYSAAHDGNIQIVDDETYVNIVKSQFSGMKRHILLSKEIPKGFTNSQLNNARHIARRAMELLSHIVREEGEVEFRSRNVLPVTGRITSELKRAWKLNDVWTELVAPRYKRMNELTQSNLFGREQISKSGHKYFDCSLDETLRENDESYDIKRIDHRHHALDALIVALCTEGHVNYINNINANARSDNYGKQKQIERYRETLKRKIMFSRLKKDSTKDSTKENDWFYLLPGELRQLDAENSRRDTVLTKSYFYKEFDSCNSDYKQVVLTALQHTIVTYKHNMRVINKTVNRYNNTPNRNSFVTQDIKNGKNYNWSIRRSLGQSTFYGKRTIDGEKKAVIRKALDNSFNSLKIETITDKGIRRILVNHLRQFDTVELPFEEATNHYEALLEKAEFEAIVQNAESGFKDVNEFIEHLKANKYKFNKVDYSKLNVFVEQVPDKGFRNEKRTDDRNKYKIEEHPEIAFAPERISEMNSPVNLKALNEGRNHTSIKKVQISRGFEKQRPAGDDKFSVKSKQYVATDKGSNLYLGFYERRYLDESGDGVRERKFQEIGLMELIEILKQDKSRRHNPLPDIFIDKKDNEYKWIFTLSPLDLVYVPTKEEIEEPSLVRFDALSTEQINRLYVLNNYTGGDVYFSPVNHSKAIHPKEVDLKIDQKSNSLKGSFADKTTSTAYSGQIKYVCWKLKIDRLGNISKARTI